MHDRQTDAVQVAKDARGIGTKTNDERFVSRLDTEGLNNLRINASQRGAGVEESQGWNRRWDWLAQLAQHPSPIGGHAYQETDHGALSRTLQS